MSAGQTQPSDSEGGRNSEYLGGYDILTRRRIVRYTVVKIQQRCVASNDRNISNVLDKAVRRHEHALGEITANPIAMAFYELFDLAFVHKQF